MDALMSKKRVRASHTKSKTGCRTCKTRRVKCDESKPACRNCCSTGRKCEGYGTGTGTKINIPAPKDVVLTIQNAYPTPASDVHGGPNHMTVLLNLPQLNDEERICFDFFRSKTLVKLPGVFYSHFWHRLVLQACVSEPSVLHAVIALGSAHKTEEDTLRSGSTQRQSPNQDEIGRRELFTIQEYSKAIGHLQRRKTQDRNASLRVVLITCILFVTLDLLRGEYGNAQTHTKSGWKLMRELQSSDRSKTTPQLEIDMSSDATSVDESLSESLSCWSVYSALFGCRSTLSHLEISQPAHLSDSKMPSIFRNISEARRSFHTLLGDVLALRQDCRSFDYRGAAYPSEFGSRQNCLRSAIVAWKMAYSRSREALIRQPDNEHDAAGVFLLRIHLSMTSIMVETALSGGRQNLFDDYTSHFTSIITQTLTLLKRVGQAKVESREPFDSQELNGDFIADVGMLPFMYYTALKCRVPWIRRQAIALLMATPIREGMWDVFIMAHVARKVMTIEEDGFFDSFADEIEPEPFASPLERNERLKHIPPLPESSRFYDVEPEMYDMLKGKGKLVLRRQKPDAEGCWEEVTSVFDFSELKKEGFTDTDYSPLYPDCIAPGSGGGRMRLTCKAAMAR